MPWDMDDEMQEENVAQAAAIDAIAQSVQVPVGRGQPVSAVDSTGIAREYQTINEAQRRFAKATLYQALLNLQQPFGTGGATAPEIIEEVTQELHSFALERMEVMLGMRGPTAMPVATDPAVTFTPSEVEMVREILRQALSGNLLIMGKKPRTALELLLTKITGEAQPLAMKLTPSTAPATTEAQPAFFQPPPAPVATPIPVGQTTVASAPAPAPVQPQPRPQRARNKSRIMNSPNRLPMPNLQTEISKVAAESQNGGVNSTETIGANGQRIAAPIVAPGNLLGAAIQAAIANQKNNPDAE